MTPTSSSSQSSRFLARRVAKLLAILSGLSLLVAILFFFFRIWQAAIGALAVHWVLGFVAMQFSRRAKSAPHESGPSSHNPA